jgi:hypothetical protein
MKNTKLSRFVSRASVVALALGCAAAASARTEVLRWQHPNPTAVTGFRVLVGNASGSYQTTLDVGLPTASGGVYSYSLQVPDPNTVYVVVRAYGATGNESPPSNENRLLGLLGTPGQPTVAP